MIVHPLPASAVAEMLGVHVNTVKKLGNSGELPFWRVGKRGDRRHDIADVLAYVQRSSAR